MKRLLLLLFIACSSALASFDLTEVENCLPFYVTATADIEAPDDKVIRKGQRGVLIRPTEANELLVNFGREGSLLVSPDKTDVVSIDAATCAQTAAAGPRINQFLFNRLMRGSSAWTLPLGVEEVRDASSWLFLYGSADSLETKAAIHLASEYQNGLPEETRATQLIVYLDRDGDKRKIQALAHELKPSIAAMPGYLSKGYFQSFEHVDPDGPLPQLVELHASGRIKNHIKGFSDVHAFFTPTNDDSMTAGQDDAPNSFAE